MIDDGKPRCSWCLGDPLYLAYHDAEWGVPCHDDRRLFEMLILEGFQAGLSWRTILGKRDNFRRAFGSWDAERIAAYGPDDVARLLTDPGIVCNHLKVEGVIANARAYLCLVEATGSFDCYLWSFVGGAPLAKAAPASLAEVPVRTTESDAMAKDLKRRGFTFIGSTICYAFMQSFGMVNDHLAECWLAAPTPP